MANHLCEKIVTAIHGLFELSENAMSRFLIVTIPHVLRFWLFFILLISIILLAIIVRVAANVGLQLDQPDLAIKDGYE